MESFTFYLVGGIAVINLIAFFYLGSDKHRSMEPAEYGTHTRVREVNFFVWAIFFGSLGVLLGMFYFHHKTRNFNFLFGIGILVIQHLALTYLLIDRFA
jgi:uncharacterized membrane protein YsdA (DUF1294 family)